MDDTHVRQNWPKHAPSAARFRALQFFRRKKFAKTARSPAIYSIFLASAARKFYERGHSFSTVGIILSGLGLGIVAPRARARGAAGQTFPGATEARNMMLSNGVPNN